eukprot:TRINITY_DN1383_c0_g1_i3.p1 TRINITY_DN1383_c0_g1~~TRINITY_DN1383_c0_g1_i3.p1  ORF type:complete len:177 (+),score=32.40 TRINITY_DN1383_c0_g1_i3:159-689(+)
MCAGRVSAALVLLVALAEATPSSGNDPQSSCGSCVSAGSYEFGVACGDTEYTVKVGDVKVTSSGILPSVSDMSTSIAEWLKIPAKRVECAGWSIGSNNITCSVKDERAVHSASYMLRMMHLEASKGNLMIAGAQVGSFKFTWQSEVLHGPRELMRCRAWSQRKTRCTCWRVWGFFW